MESPNNAPHLAEAVILIRFPNIYIVSHINPIENILFQITSLIEVFK